MDWQIKSLSKKSSKSGADLKPGDVVVSVVFVNDAGELDRLDFLKSELDEASVGVKFLGRWERVVSDNPQEDERQARRMALAGSEDFFVSLFDDDSLSVEHRGTLQQMLALLLERKRILRAVGRPSGGVQKYLHAASKREFDVPQKDLDAALIMNIQSQLDAFLI